MKACILTIGSELLDGSRENTNGRFLARALTMMGIEVVGMASICDAAAAIDGALRDWIGRADLVVMTGGLGATPDDRTRQAISRALARPLTLHAPSVERIRRRLKGRSGGPEESAALLPLGADALENPLGLAPGFILREAGTTIIALPGVPREMEAMWEGRVREALEGRMGQERRLWRVLHTCGLPETAVAARVEPRLPSGVRAAYLPRPGGVDLRLDADGREPDISRLLAQVLEEVAGELGDAVYGRDGETLEEAVGALLVRSSRTLVLAESVTGGSLAARLISVPGSSRYLMAAIVAYSNRSKEDLLDVAPHLLVEHGAVSGEAARAMADGARRRLGADVAVSTTGIAGPGGATPEKPVGTVHIGLSAEGLRRSFRYEFRSDRAGNIERAGTAALNLLRLYLTGRLVEGDASP